MMSDPVEKICKKIQASRRIAITSHLRPDGDSICTGLALQAMGSQLGITMDIYNSDQTPFPFNQLPERDKIVIGKIPPENFDAVILLECANVTRSGQEHLDEYFKINIDHHYSNDYYAEINWVDPEAPAVSCMAFSLGKRLGIRFTPQISNYLYCAIVSDTGSFQFSNTNAQAFEVCQSLIQSGASPIQTSEFLYNNNPPEKIKLLGQVLATLRMNSDGSLAVITMFQKNLNDLNLKEIETEEITTLARSISGIQMVLFFKEVDTDIFRVSLRSKGEANAAMVAEHFGGGGHVHAAGFTVKGPYARLMEEIPETVGRLLKSGPSDKEKDKKDSSDPSKSWTV